MERVTEGWNISIPSLALLEANRSSRDIEMDGDEPLLVVSNENLAQCLGEAFVAWRSTKELQKKGG